MLRQQVAETTRPAVAPAKRQAHSASDTEPYQAAIDWETSRIEQIERSERRAWLIASIATTCAVLLVIAIALMLPLKESVPYVIRVDNATGVPDLITHMDEKDVTFEEVMDKYWLALYIRAREAYDWYMIQKDYDTVGLLSTRQVGAEYNALFEGEDALDKKYKDQVRVTVDIVSVVPNGGGLGTVRFIKTTKRVDDPTSTSTVTQWVATVAYEYRGSAPIRERVRLVNPFGFQVLSYRVDPEM